MVGTDWAGLRMNLRQKWTARRTIVLIWLAWVVILLLYQSAVTARFAAVLPDRVLPWTAAATQPDRSLAQPYLQELFLNARVAWDSEFYLSIALHGYDDPLVRTIPPQPDAQPPFDRPLSLNYAFFPVYPLLMRVVAAPLSLLGLNAIATATIAGVLISILGTLAAMLALFDLAQPSLGEAGGMRAAFYLIAFPTGFFLAQVYTEGLFVGLAFSALALVQRRQWFWAGGFATIATLTKAVGVLLVIPLGLAWLQAFMQSPERKLDRTIGSAAIVLLPIITLLIWKTSFLGGAFRIVEKQFFQCEPFALDRAWTAWRDGFLALAGSNPPTTVFYAIEFAAIGLGLTASLLTLRRDPGIAVYGLLLIAISTTCGVAQGLPRYILPVPAIFLVLSHWGKSELFDRFWTLTSVLLMGLLATLFSLNLWVG
jgi:hypothetical protein